MHCEPDLFVRERFKLFFQFMNFLFECRDTVFSNIGTHTFTLETFVSDGYRVGGTVTVNVAESGAVTVDRALIDRLTAGWAPETDAEPAE